jgi:signal transduction histidine kinase
MPPQGVFRNHPTRNAFEVAWRQSRGPPELKDAMLAPQANPAGTVGTGTHATAPLAWALWTLSTLLIASSLLLDFLTPGFLAPAAQRPDPVLVVSSGLLALACSTVGAFVASHLPRKPIGWILCGIGLLYAVRRFAMAYANYALLVQPSLPGGEYAAWISTWLRFSGLILLGVFLVLLFPGGHLPARRWRVAAWTATAGAAMLAVGDALRFGPLPIYYHAYNPRGIADSVSGVLSTQQLFEALTVIGGVLLLAGCLASLVVLVQRLRRARGEERRQLSWFSYAAIPALLGSIVALLDWTVERFALLFFGKTLWPVLWVSENAGLFGKGSPAADRLTDLRLDTILESLTALAFLAIPICTGVAILKYHLYAQDLVVTRRVRRSMAAISALSWSRILLAGTVVGFLPFVLNLAVYTYLVYYPAFIQRELGFGQLAETVALVSGWGGRILFLVTTILAAWWVAQRAKARATLQGILMGLLAAIVNQIIIYYSYTFMMSYFYRPVTLGDLSLYVALGIAGGWLGGVQGSTTLAGEIYGATRRIGEADNSHDIAAAIGEHLGGADVHDVTLWRATPREVEAGGTAEEYVCWGYWTPDGEVAWPPGTRLRELVEVPILTRFEGRPSMVLRSAALSPDERAAWERRGIRSVLLIPLIAPGEVRVGLLTATFRQRRRFSRSLVRAYLTVSTQAALALENMRLVEEARRTGREAGLLDERQRLAREIHDTLAQGFTGIITNLTAAQMAQPQAAGEASRTLHLKNAERIARESLAEARRLVWALRPQSLDRRSLSEALHRLAEAWSEETGVRTRASTSGTLRPLLPEIEVALLRAAQEALANVRKHARASEVNITLSYMDDCVALDVVDNGEGFDLARKGSVEAHVAGGFGLVAMRERIEQLGGALVVESTPGEGTALAVELPIVASEPEARSSDARKPQNAEGDQ